MRAALFAVVVALSGSPGCFAYHQSYCRGGDRICISPRTVTNKAAYSLAESTASNPFGGRGHSSSSLNFRHDKSSELDHLNSGKYYNDDAFGLIFLGSLAGFHDYLFAAIFAACSFGCVAALRFNKDLSYDARGPGAVAFVALVTSIVIALVDPSIYQKSMDAVLFEAAASTLSIVWGWVQSNRNP
jgi:hypothetical protein